MPKTLDRQPQPATKPDEDVIVLTASVGALVDIRAADGDAGPKLKKFSMPSAYSGGAMDFGTQWYVDLAGLDITSKSRPVFDAHYYDFRAVVGHTTDIRVVEGRLAVDGLISGVGESAQVIQQLAENGFPMQASIGVRIRSVERVEPGATAAVNGREVIGPAMVARRSTLKEISFAALGADDNTNATIAASAALRSDPMSSLNTNPAAVIAAAAPPAAPAAAATQAVPAGTDADSLIASNRLRIAEEYRRIASIESSQAPADLKGKAIAEGWTGDKLELETLRAARPVVGAPAIHAGERSHGWDAPVIQAALAIATNGKIAHATIERDYGAQTVEAAQKRFGSNGLGVEEVILEAAHANGMSVRSINRTNVGPVLKAAFSTIALSNSLGAVANKVAVSSFLEEDQSWRKIANRRPTKDFKTMTSVRLVAGMKYKTLGPTGEVKRADASEVTYTNRADTRAILFTIDRQSIINDDAGVFTQNLANMGRGGALAFNEAFWTEFLDNASFFASGNSNYFEGAGTTLQVTQLDVASKLLLEQTDGKSNPINVGPAFLVVPPALGATAKVLYTSAEVRDTTASTKIPVGNPFQNTFEPVVVPYLSTAFGLTGSSQTAWYLVGAPRGIGVMDALFLDGVETPTVESVELAEDAMGIGVRGYFDFGVGKMEYRMGVKSKGAA